MNGRLLIFSSVIVSLFIHFPAFAETVLVIQSYHGKFSWDREYIKGLKKELGKSKKLHYFSMNTKRIPQSDYARRAELAWKKYLKLKPNYVILGDDNALKFLGQKLAETKTPVVFLGINGNPRVYFKEKKIPGNMTGVLDRPSIYECMKQLKMTLPDVKRVLIMFDDGHTSRAAIGDFMRQINSPEMKKLGLQFEIKFISKQKEWRDTVKAAKSEGYGAIFAGTYHTLTNKNGRHISSQRVMRWMHDNSELPIYSFWLSPTGGKKSVGGVLLDPYEHGVAAAQMILAIEKGEQPQVLSVTKGKVIYSRTGLKRWDIKLPLSLEKEATFVD